MIYKDTTYRSKLLNWLKKAGFKLRAICNNSAEQTLLKTVGIEWVGIPGFSLSIDRSQSSKPDCQSSEDQI